MSSRRIRIYATQDARHVNLAPALDHGDEIVAMTPAGDANFSTNETMAMVMDHLQVFDPEHDKMLLVGDPLVMLMAGAIYRDLYDEPLKVLKWDRATSRYIEILLDFGQGE